MGNINSFVETTNNLVNQVNIALASMQKMNDAMTTDEDSVVISVQGTDPITGDPSTYTYAIPSFHYSLSQLSRISNTVDTFVNGQGVVLLNDGTYRQVTTIPVAMSPTRITGIGAPSNFNVRPNWFFENMMFPQIFVRFNLKGKIDDRSDRIIVDRVIFDNSNDIETQWFKDTFIGKTYLYQDVINILVNNGKNYFEDVETLELPLRTRPYTGNFLIINKGTVNNEEWFYLDTINYGFVTDSSTVKNIQLKVGDELRYNNSLFQIDQIVTQEQRVHLVALIGLGSPTINQSFDIYSVPFENKFCDIAIGFDECEIIFIKGVNDDFNIIADEWSDSIAFYSNDLSLVNSNTTLSSYYYNFISDFGRQMEGQAKEKFVPAFYGLTPNPPSIIASQFVVSQINTQTNAALDINSIKNTQTQIESTKTIINSLKTTIAQQKSNLVELTDPAQRADLQNKINDNINQLSNETVQYDSLVKSLATLAYENNAVLADPIYRVRGFFAIPLGVSANPNEPLQEIIQFEIAYRYLRLDNTANPLNTYTHTDPSTGQTITGVFTDWQIVSSPIKTRKYDASSGKFIWVEENISDGNVVNINQVDIPIQQGEKVQLKIRSISEAGWPTNPLKSDWCDPVIIDFPINLQGSDQVVNILKDAEAEEISIQLDQTLNAAGIYTHIQDGVPNPNSASGTYFKHQSQFLAFDLEAKDINGNIITETTIDLQSEINDLSNKTYITLTRPSGSINSYQQITGTLQQLFQAMVNSDPSIYDEFQVLIQ